jgi:hypothetical protein
MRPEKQVSHVPIEARLRNARPLITTLPPIALLVAAAVAVSLWSTPRPTEIAGTGAVAVPATVATAVGEPSEVDPASVREVGSSSPRGANSLPGQLHQARVAR